MKANVGSVDRVIRIIIGIGILSFVLILQDNLRWVGLIGLIPLVTAMISWCPLYSFVGISSCSFSKPE
jgi:hypothetical protein